MKVKDFMLKVADELPIYHDLLEWEVQIVEEKITFIPPRKVGDPCANIQQKLDGSKKE